MLELRFFADRNGVVEQSVLHSLPAVIALELVPGTDPGRLMLDRDEADTLAGLMAEDLRALLPGVEQARLALVGAHFDAVELLRPGFPVHATLDELARRLPARHGSRGVVAFGAHEGHMPAEPLNPQRGYLGGPMRLLPWSLLAPENAAAELGERMEVELVGRGELGARTADFLMRHLDVRLEHARYLSRNDLLALTCVQYEHANLAALWSLIEAALLSPYREETALSARGLELRYAEGSISVPAPSVWLRDHAAGDAGERAHALAGMLFELRQSAALLHAHGIGMGVHDAHADVEPALNAIVETLAQVDPGRAAPALFAQQAPGLGTVALSVAQNDGTQSRVLAHAYPLGGSVQGLVGALADRYGVEARVAELGRLHLDTDGALGVPAEHALH
jgi:hypothetical protein